MLVVNALERPMDYLVKVNVWVSEYCDEGRTDGCLEEWSIPKTTLLRLCWYSEVYSPYLTN